MTPDWQVLKSGARRGPDNWTASKYLEGWYFTHFVVAKSSAEDPYSRSTTVPDKHFGPFNSFEAGLRDWSKNK